MSHTILKKVVSFAFGSTGTALLLSCLQLWWSFILVTINSTENMEFSFFWNLEGLSCENETAIWQIWRKNKLGKFAAESFIITLLSVVKSYRVATFFPQNIVIAFLFWRLRWFPGCSSLSWFSLCGLAEDILRISWHRNNIQMNVNPGYDPVLSGIANI